MVIHNYNPEDIIRCYIVKDKWKDDKKRIELIKELGYNVLIIWGNDYKKDKKRIEICKKWIKNL